MPYYLIGKQAEIVDLVYKFRFMNRHQIQRALNHKGPRRINTWLKELTEKKFLGRIYSNKLLENTKPGIYYLSYAGISYVKEDRGFSVNEVKKFYEDKNRSQTFIDHCITSCQLLYSLKKYENEIRKYDISSKEMLLKNHFLSELKVDGYIKFYKKKTKKSKDHDLLNTFILDVIDPGVPRYAIRYRINQYINYHQGETWKESINNFPIIMLIFPTKQKQNQFAKYIRTQLDEGMFTQGMTFMLTTYQQAIEHGLTNGIWVEIKEE